VKIKIIKSQLLDALKDVQPGANAKKTIVIYGNVKLDAHDGELELTTTNGEISLYAKISCTVETPGSTTLPMRLLASVVAAMPEGEVVLDGPADTVKILGGSSRFVVRGLPASDFPKLPDVKATHRYAIEAKKFGTMLRQTSYAQSQDDTRRTLMSVLLDISNETIRAVATDGRRLAIAEQGLEGTSDSVQYIIPSSTVAVLQKFCDRGGNIVIEDTNGQLKVTMCDGAVVVYTVLVDGAYPSYGKVIPQDNPFVAKIDREMLISALDRVSVLAMTMTGECSVKMTFADNLLNLKVVGDGNNSGMDEIPLKYEGDMIEIMFNPRYVLDPLRSSTADEIEFVMKNGSTAAIIKSAAEKFLCVLMPMRIN